MKRMTLQRLGGKGARKGQAMLPAPGALYQTHRDVLEGFAEPEGEFLESFASSLTARP